jgi:hypothetical protein
MATPSKKAGDSNPLHRPADFNPMAMTWSPLHTPRPYALLRGASTEESGPVIVPGEPVVFTFRNET